MPFSTKDKKRKDMERSVMRRLPGKVKFFSDKVTVRFDTRI